MLCDEKIECFTTEKVHYNFCCKVFSVIPEKNFNLISKKNLKNFLSIEIQDIKQRLNILTVLSHYNLKPDRNSRLCCPLHNDKTPSFQV